MLQGAQQKVQVLVGVNTVIAQNKTIHQEWGECPVPFLFIRRLIMNSDLEKIQAEIEKIKKTINQNQKDAIRDYGQPIKHLEDLILALDDRIKKLESKNEQ